MYLNLDHIHELKYYIIIFTYMYAPNWKNAIDKWNGKVRPILTFPTHINTM